MPEYKFLLDFMSYFQMFTLLNLGLIFMDKNSAVIKLQDKILREIQVKASPYLTEAGELTRKCRKNLYESSHKGLVILGLAEMIRTEKEAFREKTELEKYSLFMPAMGLTSGMFCLVYLLFIPLLSKTGNLFCLYFLEYTAVAVFISQAVAILTLFYNDAYRNFLSAILISLIWFLLPLTAAILLYVCNCNITCFSIEFYLFLFLLLPVMPIVTLIMRIICIVTGRINRLKRIKKKTAELSGKLAAYKSKDSVIIRK